jgi:hypothetical protein
MSADAVVGSDGAEAVIVTPEPVLYAGLPSGLTPGFVEVLLVATSSGGSPAFAILIGIFGTGKMLFT